jgi:hypothetical protein
MAITSTPSAMVLPFQRRVLNGLTSISLCNAFSKAVDEPRPSATILPFRPRSRNNPG